MIVPLINVVLTFRFCLFFPNLSCALRIEEAKRAIKRPLSNERYDDDRDRDRKRSTNDSRRFEAPPPPRFDTVPIR